MRIIFAFDAERDQWVYQVDGRTIFILEVPSADEVRFWRDQAVRLSRNR